MDFKNSGVTSTTFSIENGSITPAAVVKEYISLPTFCLMIDILGAGQLVSQYAVPSKEKIEENWVIDWRERVTRNNICKTFDSIPSDKTNEGGTKKAWM